MFNIRDPEVRHWRLSCILWLQLCFYELHIIPTNETSRLHAADVLSVLGICSVLVLGYQELLPLRSLNLPGPN